MPLLFLQKKMIKYFIIYLTFCSTSLICAEYDVGDIVNMDDQEERFTICNGEHFNNDFKLSHINGDVNGGHYFVSWFDISATW